MSPDSDERPPAAEMVTNWDLMVERIRRNRILFSMAVALILVVSILVYASTGGSSEATDFTVTDTKGNVITLSDFEGEKVVVLDFMFSTCTPCKNFVKEHLKPFSKEMDKDEVVILSISILKSDSKSALDDMADDYGWAHAIDKTGDIKRAYDVGGTPTIIIINKDGQITKDHEGAMSKSDLEDEVDAAIEGTASLAKVKENSIYVLAVVSGFVVFFSPCAFPLLPGYMSYFLANKKKSKAEAFNEDAAKEALPPAIAASVGLIGILLLIGLIMIPFINIIGDFVPLLELIVGLLIAIMGIVMIKDYSLEPVLAPLRGFWYKVVGAITGGGGSGKLTASAERVMQKVAGDDFNFEQSKEEGMVGMFFYGVGYGSAAAGCVAPIVIALLIASTEVGPVQGLIAFLLFAATAGILMTGFTLMVAAAEHTSFINQMKNSTERIRIAGGAIMVIVGVYLMSLYLRSL